MVLEHTRNATPWRWPIPESVDALRRCTRRGVPMGVVSNASGQIEEVLRRSGVCQVGDGAARPVRVVIDSHRRRRRQARPADLRLRARALPRHRPRAHRLRRRLGDDGHRRRPRPQACTPCCSTRTTTTPTPTSTASPRSATCSPCSTGELVASSAASGPSGRARQRAVGRVARRDRPRRVRGPLRPRRRPRRGGLSRVAAPAQRARCRLRHRPCRDRARPARDRRDGRRPRRRSARSRPGQGATGPLATGRPGRRCGSTGSSTSWRCRAT